MSNLTDNAASPEHRTLSFQAVIFRHLLVLTMLPVLTVAGACIWYYGNLLESSTTDQLRGSALRVHDAIRSWLESHRDAVATAAFGIGESGVDLKPEPLGRWLEQVQSTFPGFLTMLVADRQGKILVASRRGWPSFRPDPSGVLSVHDRDYFRIPVQTGQDYMSGIFRGRGLGTDNIVALSSPIRNGAGDIMGVLEGSIDITRIPLTPDTTSIKPLVIALDGKGDVVYASSARLPGWGDLEKGLRQIPAGTVVEVGATDNPQFAVRIPIHGTNWEVVAALPVRLVRAQSQTFSLYALLLLTAGIAVVWRAASVISRRVARPIVEMAGSLRQYEVGDRLALPEADSPPEELVQIRTEMNKLGIRLHMSYEGLRSAIAERDRANSQLAGLLESLDRKVVERTAALADSEARYALSARGSNDGIWDWDLRSGEIYYSQRWREMLGITPETELRTIESWLALAHPEDAERLKREFESRAAGGADSFQIEYRLRHADGTWRWMLARGACEFGADGRLCRMAGSQSDITAGKLNDPLTGMPNRIAILERVQALVELAREDDSRHFAVLFIDLDRFKLVNDSLGHMAGDQLLLDVAQRLGAAVRSVPDTTGLVGRLGGDEFVVVLDGLPEREAAELTARAIQEEMRPPFHLNNAVIFSSGSIGVAHSARHYRLAEEMLRDADTAMYHAKSRGRSEVATFDEGMRARAVERLEIESALRQAINREEFVLYYQPQFELRDHRLAGMEVLVRWQHPTRGLVMPGEFIPIAEETGLIQPLGRWILEAACRQLVEWRRQPGRENLTVSVNLSGRQFTEPNLADQIRKVLEDTGLPARNLHLEVTESVLADDPDQARSTLDTLASMGIGLEVDDFGTGYSSLGQLHRLPFRTLKIDRSFVQAIHTAQDGLKLVNSILMLARSLGLTSVAEGIETVEHQRQLALMGCDLAQGYYFSPPVNATRMEALLQGEVGWPLPDHSSTGLLSLNEATSEPSSEVVSSFR